jgi:uncharacterized membrane protein
MDSLVPGGAAVSCAIVAVVAVVKGAWVIAVFVGILGVASGAQAISRYKNAR